MAEQDTAKLSYDMILKNNTKLQKEAAIFHKVKHDKEFTSADVAEYAASQIETKKDLLEVLKTLRANYVKMDYLPDVRKIRTFDNLIEDAQTDIDFYTLMKKEFTAQKKVLRHLLFLLN